MHQSGILFCLSFPNPLFLLAVSLTVAVLTDFEKAVDFPAVRAKHTLQI
jgi:hypothetical protein